MLSLKGYVSGKVQGVSFRYFVQQQASQRDVSGYAKNLDDGRVEFLLQGEKASVNNVVEQIHRGPSLAKVDKVEVRECKFDEAISGFKILNSDS